MIEKIKEIIGKENEGLLTHKCTTIPKENLAFAGKRLC